MNGNKSVGELLKECRLRSGKTQEEMARYFDVNRSMISRWETDEIAASYTTVRLWCAYTQGQDLMALDITGGRDAWKKYRQMEATMHSMKSVLADAHLMKKRKEKRNGTGWFGALRGRI